MPISEDRASRHYSHWSRHCARPFWPKYLFHHAHVTAVAQSLLDGELRSRASQPHLVHDVANQAAIASNPAVLDFVRLYFRPLTDFHLSTEGIKLRTDPFRMNCHMSIPIALLFNFEKVITRVGVGFSGRKLAHNGTSPSFCEGDFDKIDFSSVYHEGPLSSARRKDVNDQRMGEVVVPSILSLMDNLEFIVCRNAFDEMTLRHLAADADQELLRKIRVASSPNHLFFCRGLFIRDLEFQDDFLKIQLHPGNCARAASVKYRIEQWIDGTCRSYADFERTVEQSAEKAVKVRPFDRKPNALWKIWLEDVLAFEGKLPYGQSELVRA